MNNDAQSSLVLQQLKALAAYHAAMNRRFYKACEALSDEQLNQDAGLFFGSIMGTLNHMLLTDQVWLATFQQQKYPFESHDQILHSGFAELAAARRETDAAIGEWIETLTPEALADGFHDRLTFPLWLAVTHFFNHQTHHRGQLSAALSALGIDYGITDLPWIPEVSAVLEA